VSTDEYFIKWPNFVQLDKVGARMNGGFSQNSLSSQVHCFGGLCKNPQDPAQGEVEFAINERVPEAADVGEYVE